MTRDAGIRALERQIERLTRRIDRLRAASRRFSWGRLGLLLASTAAGWGTFRLAGDTAGWIAIVILVAIFALVMHLHHRLDRAAARFVLWRELKEAHLARMRLDWEKIPQPASLSPDPEHPYEADLDLVGPRSLHHLLDVGVTLEGSERLRAWLRATPESATAILARQGLVRELTPRTIFRDKLGLYTRLASRRTHERWEANRLLPLLRNDASIPRLRTTLIGAAILTTTTVVFAVLAFLGTLPEIWPIPLVLYLLLLRTQAEPMKKTFNDAVAMELALAKFAAGFRHIETFNYADAPRLRELASPFLDAAARPSVHLRGISRIAAWVSLQANPLLWALINFIVPFSLFLTWRLAISKERVGTLLPRWLDVWFEMEALSSLANFAELNPHYTFPEITPREERPIFQATELGHPLIPHERKSRNDYRVESTGEVTIITGSNMAGKSTFLRTLGINLVLAYAGAPADAPLLRTTIFRVFTSIRINDSLSDGFSFFYAEVRRLRALLTELEGDGPLPIFFLIDEIFRGTNNRERLIGSRSYIRALAGGNGAGVVATHDLELVRLADEIPQLRNMHFREHVEDGTMVFDYKLRNGPCPTTNALVIMRMAGLPVSGADGAAEL